MNDAPLQDDPDYQEYAAQLATMDADEFLDHIQELQLETVINDDTDGDHAMLRAMAQADYFQGMIHNVNYFLNPEKKLDYIFDLLKLRRSQDGLLDELDDQILDSLMEIKREDEDNPALAAKCNLLVLDNYNPYTCDLWPVCQHENIDLFKKITDGELQLRICSFILRDETLSDHDELPLFRTAWLMLMENTLKSESEEDAPEPEDILSHCNVVLENPRAIDDNIFKAIENITAAAIIGYAERSIAYDAKKRAQAEGGDDTPKDILFPSDQDDDDLDDDKENEKEDLSAIDTASIQRYPLRRLAVYMRPNDDKEKFWGGWLAQHVMVEYADKLNKAPKHDQTDANLFAKDVLVHESTKEMNRWHRFIHHTIQDGTYTQNMALHTKQRAANPDNRMSQAFEKQRVAMRENADKAVAKEGGAPGAHGSKEKIENLGGFVKNFCYNYAMTLAKIEEVPAPPDAPNAVVEAVEIAQYHLTELYSDFIKNSAPTLLKKDDQPLTGRQKVLRTSWLHRTTIQHAPDDSLLRHYAQQQKTMLDTLCLPFLNRAELEKSGNEAHAHFVKDQKIKRHFDLN